MGGQRLKWRSFLFWANLSDSPAIDSDSGQLSDGHRSHAALSEYRHDPRVVRKMAGHIPLPWIHLVFALLKPWGLGTCHGLRCKHVDRYLNEFVLRYNRCRYRRVSFEVILGLGPSADGLLGHHRPQESARRPVRRAQEAAAAQDRVRLARRSAETRKNADAVAAETPWDKGTRPPPFKILITWVSGIASEEPTLSAAFFDTCSVKAARFTELLRYSSSFFGTMLGEAGVYTPTLLNFFSLVRRFGIA